MMMVRFLCLGFVTAAGLGQAAAADPAYVGTWTDGAKATCKLDQSNRKAPMRLSGQGFDQHETHCTFTSVEPKGANAWVAKAVCAVEGDKQKHTFALKVSGNRLILSEGGRPRKFTRCR